MWLLGGPVPLPGTIGYILSGLPHAGVLPPFSLGYVNLAAVAVIVPLSALMVPLGVKTAHTLPKHVLQQILAATMALVSLRMLMTL